MANTDRNTLNIANVTEMMTAEHAAKALASEFWWTIVPSTEDSGSFAETGSSSQFWALVTAIRELGQPLGFHKVENHLGNLAWRAHNKPDIVLAGLIKPAVRTTKPEYEFIKQRAAYTGEDADQLFAERINTYNAEVVVAEAKNSKAIAKILSQEPAPGEAILETSTIVDYKDFDEETGDFAEHEVVYGEHMIPVNRMIKHIESQIDFLAKNKKIPDEVFTAEHLLYKSELAAFQAIIQFDQAEGAAPDYVAAMDDKLLEAAGMQAGVNSGK